jgi:hypothetical protein
VTLRTRNARSGESEKRTNSSGVTRCQPSFLIACRNSWGETLPFAFIPVFEDMLREGHFPKLFVVIDGEPSNAIDSHRNVPPPRELTAHSLTIDEYHGHNGAVQSKVE